MAEAITKTSFDMGERGILADLHHQESGLPARTILSNSQGLKWEVGSRILFMHAAGEQKLFENEQTSSMSMKFSNSESQQQSVEDIKSREQQNIFMYLLQPLGHSSKLSEEGTLIITY